MIVLCVGPESSGTRLLTRQVDLLGVTAIHRSIPHADKWWDAVEFDAAIFISRDPWITEISGVSAGHRDNFDWSDKDRQYPYRLTNAWKCFSENVILPEKKWIPVTYEGLVRSPQWTLDNIAAWLEVPPALIVENISDPRVTRSSS